MIQEICKTILNESSVYTLNAHALTKKHKDDIFAETSHFPEKISLSKRIRALAEGDECICKHCGTVHGDTTKNGFCGKECRDTYRKENAITKEEFPQYNAIRLGNRKFEGKIEGVDYMVCAICTAKTGELGSHIRMHNITNAEYKAKYNLSTLKTQKQIASVTGANNPAYQHGGKYSPFSTKFINAETTDRKELVEKAAKTRADNNNNTTSIEYWLKKTDGNVEEAQKLLSKRQTTFSLKQCIEKHGEEKGLGVWKDRQVKWSKSCTDVNYSTISQLLFNDIMKVLPDKYKSSVYYATYNRPDMIGYQNKEYILDVGMACIRPDFICVDIGKIIEFDGDYWHSSIKANPIREENRDNMIFDSGMEVLHIKEQDYKNNKEDTITRCITFLTQ